MTENDAAREASRTGGTERRGVAAWCLYDWAGQPFPTVIGTFVFSAYFTQAVAVDEVTGTTQWSLAVTTSALIIAVLSPILGAVSDAAGPKKPWLVFFTVLCALACAALWWVRPEEAWVVYALVAFAIANVAFELGIVFYNAMLPDIAPPHRIGRISGWGWGLGYAGGLACLVFLLLVFVQAETPPFGLDRDSAEHVRVVGPFSALWMVVFALPLFLLTPDSRSTGIAAWTAVRQGLSTLASSIWNIRRQANVLRYLVARMIYTDGLNTVFAFGGIYAAGTFGMTIEEVIMFGIALNVTAGLGAAGFAWVDDWIGAKKTVLISLGFLTAIATGILLVESKTAFWVLATVLGIFFGPAQAASRSLMARLAPAELRAEMFGLYALSGKATAFLGPLVLGIVTEAFASQRAGMATVLVFFVVGGVLLLGVREPSR